MIRVGVSGAAGRMGETVCAAVERADGMELAAKADPSLGVELESILGDVDVVVDFTTPDSALGNAKLCLDAGVHVVLGTTGFDLDALRAAAEGGEANCFVAPNFAIGEPIHSVRLPGLVAHQEVIFGGEGQTLSIRHDSIDRVSFMPGVLLAVRRVAELPDRFTVGLEKLL
jgi:4-hydroxy-tetrahydrodipicolinate reductase